MQTWARRSLQTALITGGLLMLGTGIASANENVNPDRPASPLDPRVKIPVRVHDNAIGTPFGQKNIPTVNRDVVVSTEAVTKGTPVAKAAPIIEKAQSVAGRLAEQKLPGIGRITPKAKDVFQGNKVSGDMIVPVEAAGNAIAAGHDAHVNATSNETYAGHSPVYTDGQDAVGAGNVVNLDWAMPVRVSGNAAAASGKATTNYVSRSATVVGGDVVTNGGDSVLAGNVVSEQLATPAQVTGNAVSGAGIAKATTDMDDQAHAPGTIKTNGDNSVVAGTGTGVPVALPSAVHGNAISAGGKSWVDEKNLVGATAGQPIGAKNGAGYISTSGRESVLSGAVAEPAIATTADATCNAVTVLGTGDCVGGTGTVTKAGGSTATDGTKSTGGGTALTPSVASPVQVFAGSPTAAGLTSVDHVNSDVSNAGGTTVTSGKDAVLAGTIADPAVAGPAETFGNAASVLGTSKTDSLNGTVTKAGGNGLSNADNSVASGTVGSAAVAMPAQGFGLADSVGGQAEALVGEQKVTTAGGESVVHADKSVIGGSAIRPSAAGPVHVLSNSATVLGRGNSDVCNDVTTTAGGYTGTTGNDSTGGGNAVTPAVGMPAEVFSNTANVGGLSSSKVDENKVTVAGAATNTHDDAGVLASNAVVTSLAGPAQLFGNSATGGGISNASAIKQTTAKAGGPAIAQGTGGAGSGNVAAAPVAMPSQAFGTATGVLGKSNSWVTGESSSTSGGGISTDGKAGTINGNAASVPGAGAVQLFGDAAGIASVVDGSADNTTASTAGGDVVTNGADGSVSGNVASAQPLAASHTFGNATALSGLVNGRGDNNTKVTNGGDITTNGDRGSVSGNLADVPVAAIAQVFGDAAGVGGTANGTGPNEITAVTGGHDTTSAKGGNLSGNLASVPVAGSPQGFGDAVSVVGNGTGTAQNDTNALSGGDAKSSGDFGSLSGNLFTAPVGAAPQAYGNAASGGGHSTGAAQNDTSTNVGGAATTDGPLHTLSGVNHSAPAGAAPQVFAVPVPVVAHAVANGRTNPLAKLEDTAPIVELPIGQGGGLAADKLPRLPVWGTFPPQQTRTDTPVNDLAGLPDRLVRSQFSVAPDLDAANVGAFGLPFLDDVADDITRTQPIGMAEARSEDRTRSARPNGLPVLSNVDSEALGTGSINGVQLSRIQNILRAADPSTLDVTQTLPAIDVVKQLPVQPDFDDLPKLT